MKKKRKKLIILIVLASIILLSIVGALLLFLPQNKEEFPEPILPDLYFYTPDYEIDILSDPEYLELNRDISYKRGAVTTTVSPESYASTDVVLAFIAEYVNTMINGDYNAYPLFFTDEYKAKNDLPEKFTMQRIYNITVEMISEERNDEGENQYIYMLDYYICKNDGTLRRDMDSDSSRPQYLVITGSTDNFKIDNIITYFNQN